MHIKLVVGQEANSLKQILQDMMPVSLEVIRGVVISENPLKIQVINDEKMIISENIMCLPRHLSSYQTTVDLPSMSGVTMTVYNGLKIGEVVYILSFNHGKKYYIMDREA